jgi:hypothetical protein
MQKRDNSKSGKFDWVQFFCGAGLGGFEGARVGFGVFSNWWSILLIVIGAAGVGALLWPLGRGFLGSAVVFRLVLMAELVNGGAQFN